MPSETALRAPSVPEPRWTSGRAAIPAALVVILAITCYRIVLALFDRTELSTDEAQYWAWGQTLDLGYYSKPPLIGWIIRAVTDLFGSTVAGVRLPAALFHGATATVLFLMARRHWPVPVAALAALGYLTSPAVALGSALMTTDTPMLLCAVIAMAAQVRLAEARGTGRPALAAAVLLGLALGLGFLAKHAMIFWLAGSVLAALVSPRFRIRGGDAGIAVAVMLAVIAPHLLWQASAGFITLTHVQDITLGSGVSVLRPAGFLAQQLLVAGPILFPAMVLAAVQAPRDAWTAGLAALALVPLLLVMVQAARGPVLANWAVLFLVPGSILAALCLVRRPRLATFSVALGLATTLALPLVKVVPDTLPAPGGQPLLARYLGREETADWALRSAAATGVRTLVAPSRSLMADLTWYGRDVALTLRALPPTGRPDHHWEMTAPFRPGVDPAPVALIWPEGHPSACAGASRIAGFAPPPGAYGGRRFVMFRLDTPDCLVAARATDG